MCDEAIDDCLEASKIVPDWFVTSKMLEKFHDVLNTNDEILFFDEHFSKATFFANEIYILGVDLDKIDLHGDNNFDEDYPETIIHVRILVWCNKFEICKALKIFINKELIPAA